MLKFARPQILFAPDGPGSGSAAPSSGSSSSGGGSSTPSSSPSSSSPASGGATASPSSPSGASSPSPSPSPAPASPAPTEPSSPGPAGGEFDGFGTAFDDNEDVDVDLQPAEAPVAEPPQSPPGQPSATPAPAEAPAPAAPAAPAPGPQEASASLPTPAEPQAIAEALMQNEQAVLEHLAQTEFKLSPEDVEALETDAPAHIPKLLARIYLKSQVNMLQQMSKVVPAMIQRMEKVAAANKANETKFYSRWPDLKQDLHGDIVKRNASLYRKMNPQASLDQMIEDLGPIVMAAAKVFPGATPAVSNGGVTPPAPGARMVTPPSPFRPAGSGPSSAPPQPGADQNPWAGLNSAAYDEDE